MNLSSLLSLGSPEFQQPAWSEIRGQEVTVRFSPDDATSAPEIGKMVAEGRKHIERFFGRKFSQPFVVLVFPDRASLTNFWREDWKIPDLQAEPWMVASGTARTLSLLSPRVWKTQAVEHDPADRTATACLLTHELVHVFHGQNSPHPDLSDLDDIGWFVEGVAVFASGQLDDKKLAPAREAVEKGLAPKRLKDGWSGKYRYGVSGSLVRYLDRNYGRKRLRDLLACTTQDQILGALGITESELLAKWQESVLRERA